MSARTQLPLVDTASECGASSLSPSVDDDAAQRLAQACKALGDPTRVRLVSLIASAQGAEACICDLTGPVGLTQPTVSHHMKQLVEAGLVDREQRGKWAFYRLVPEAFDALRGALSFDVC